MKEVNGATLEDLLGAGWSIEQIKESPEYSALCDPQSSEASVFEEAIVETTQTPIKIEEPIHHLSVNLPDMKDIPTEVPKEALEYVEVLVDFSKNVVEVSIVIDATGTVDKALASNHQLRLIHGRSYMIPVNCPKNINSDNGNIKVFSDVSALLDVRYVKNGVACVIPLRHSITLNDNQRLCGLYSF